MSDHRPIIDVDGQTVFMVIVIIGIILVGYWEHRENMEKIRQGINLENTGKSP